MSGGALSADAALQQLGLALENLDGAFDGAELAVGEPLQAQRQAGRGFGLRRELASARFGEAQFQPPAVVRVLGALHQPGTDQRVNRAADRRRTAANLRCDLVQRCRFFLADRCEKAAPGALGPFRRAIGDPVLRQCRKACGKRRR